MKGRIVLAIICLVMPAAVVLCLASPQSLTITYLYDNTSVMPGMKADWGFACLVQGNGKNILFDTGANAGVLRTNMALLHVDAAGLDALVFSHEHGDHTRGLEALGQRPGLMTFFPASFGEATRAAFTKQGLQLTPVSRATEIFPGFATSDEMGTQIHEEALVADTQQGLVVIVGCAHPGIVSMLKQISTSRSRPVHMVIGGFHLLQTPAEELKRIVGEFKEMKVAYVGATHCTGEQAIRLFQEAYGEHYIKGGVGTVVRAPIVGSR